MSKWELYWILKLDDVRIMLVIVTSFSIVGLLVRLSSICSQYDGKDEEKGWALYRTSVIYWVFFASFMAMLFTIVPSTKNYFLMMGGEYLTNNEKVITTGEKAYELLDTYMDNKLNELKGTPNELKKND